MELYHHGILGQKWGVRRYQYEDGTLTPAGRKRYSKNSTTKKVSVSNLSDAELNKRIKRLQLEQQYKKLLQPPANEFIENGRKETQKIVEKIVEGLAIPTGMFFGKKFLDKVLKTDLHINVKKK